MLRSDITAYSTVSVTAAIEVEAISAERLSRLIHVGCSCGLEIFYSEQSQVDRRRCPTTTTANAVVF